MALLLQEVMFQDRELHVDVLLLGLGHGRNSPQLGDELRRHFGCLLATALSGLAGCILLGVEFWDVLCLLVLVVVIAGTFFYHLLVV
jgi:hypothetical protein